MPPWELNLLEIVPLIMTTDMMIIVIVVVTVETWIVGRTAGGTLGVMKRETTGERAEGTTEGMRGGTVTIVGAARGRTSVETEAALGIGEGAARGTRGN